jgi:hypothetical protein
MRHSNYIFLAIFFLGSCHIGAHHHVKNVNDLEQDHLRGKVKSVTETHFNLSGDTTEIRIWKYDAKGNRLQDMAYSHRGRVQYGSVITFYDSTGRKSVDRVYEDSGNARSEKYVYDAHGREAGRIAYIGHGKYADEMRARHPTDTILRSRVSVYDNRGFKTVDTEYTGRDRIEAIIKYKYNSDSVLTADTMYRPSSRPGNGPDESEWYAALIHSYDAGGNKIKEDFIKENGYITVSYFENDDSGNMISEHHAGIDGDQKSNWTYQFDEHGNWTKRHFKSIYQDRTTTRSIEYYP